MLSLYFSVPHVILYIVANSTLFLLQVNRHLAIGFLPVNMDHLEQTLNNIVTKHPPESFSSSKGGLYYGPLSVALLFSALCDAYGPDFALADGRSLKHYLDAYLTNSRALIARQGIQVTAGHCGIINPALSLLALEAAASNGQASAKQFVQLAASAVQDETEVAAVEWLYGLAGLLYLSRMVARCHASRELQAVQDLAIEKLMKTKRPFNWHGKAYVGAAHGTAGILCQMLLTRPELAPQLEPEIEDLLETQLESGNFPSSLPAGGRDRLVQSCHGAPGVVTSLMSMRPHLSDSLQFRVDRVVGLARSCIQARGQLTKESCLCHGAAGNALALERDSMGFAHLLSTTTPAQVTKAIYTTGLMSPSDHPESLWCGEAGRAWLWALIDRDLPLRFLGYNDL